MAAALEEWGRSAALAFCVMSGLHWEMHFSRASCLLLPLELHDLFAALSLHGKIECWDLRETALEVNLLHPVVFL